MNSPERTAILHDAAALQVLAGLPEWGVFTRWLAQMIVAQTERTVSGAREDFDYNKGVLQGLRDVEALPNSVARLAEAVRNAN